MATRAELLDTAIVNVTTKLAELESLKPSYSVDGESYEWTQRFQALTTQLKVLEEARQRADGAWEVRGRAIT